mmetsp:Transcript_14555/g.31066  ORF Transcript_14555/g.31066 Transcript_14555/m.31066 type:complete len:99 (+) Transcript_14555:1342-1638(+)
MALNPPASDRVSDVGEYTTTIDTMQMLKSTLTREVLARSAMSLCKHNGSITSTLETTRQADPSYPVKPPRVSFTTMRYDSMGPQDMININTLHIAHPS